MVSRTRLLFRKGLPFIGPALLLASSLVSASARGSVPPLDDDPLDVMMPEVVEASPHELWMDGAGRGSLWVALQGAFVQRSDGKNDFGAMLLLGVPLERLAAPRDERSSFVVAEGPGGRAEDPPAEAKPAPVMIRIVTPNLARRAVAAALEHARIERTETRMDRLASRARVSALLPELRFRVTRQMDESETLSPTEYDPARVTASGGTSLWLEARATFRLDRLVFADEEVALERLRDDRAEARQKLVSKVLEALFAWQRALAAQDDPAADPEERARAAVAVVEAEATIEVLTGGWLSSWRASREEPVAR